MMQKNIKSESKKPYLVSERYLLKVYPNQSLLQDAAIGLYKHSSLSRLPLDVDELIAYSYELYRLSNIDFHKYYSLRDLVYNGLHKFFKTLYSCPESKYSNVFVYLNTIRQLNLSELSERDMELDKKLNPNRGKKNLEQRLSNVPSSIKDSMYHEFEREFPAELYEPVKKLAKMINNREITILDNSYDLKNKN